MIAVAGWAGVDRVTRLARVEDNDAGRGGVVGAACLEGSGVDAVPVTGAELAGSTLGAVDVHEPSTEGGWEVFAGRPSLLAPGLLGVAGAGSVHGMVDLFGACLTSLDWRAAALSSVGLLGAVVVLAGDGDVIRRRRLLLFLFFFSSFPRFSLADGRVTGAVSLATFRSLSFFTLLLGDGDDVDLFLLSFIVAFIVAATAGIYALIRGRRGARRGGS